MPQQTAGLLLLVLLLYCGASGGGGSAYTEDYTVGASRGDGRIWLPVQFPLSRPFFLVPAPEKLRGVSKKRPYYVEAAGNSTSRKGNNRSLL